MTTEIQSFEQPFAMQLNANLEKENGYYCPSPSETDANYLLETFHQFPHGDFRPTFYNPFEIKHRRRTSRAQLKVLEKSFSENSKPNAAVRRILAQKLDMTPRGVQIWFQNRRAKAKLQSRKASAEGQRSFDAQGRVEYHLQNKEHHHTMTNASQHTRTVEQMEQTVLFSQFFANVHTQPDHEGKPAFTSYLPPASVNKPLKPTNESQGTQAWNTMARQSNMRSAAAVAVAAAAAAAASASTSTSMASISSSCSAAAATAATQLYPSSNDSHWLVHPLTHMDNQSVNEHMHLQDTKTQELHHINCLTTEAQSLPQENELLSSYPFELESWYTHPIIPETKDRRVSDTEIDYSQPSTLMGWCDLDCGSQSTSPSSSHSANTPCLRRGWSLDTGMCSPPLNQLPVIPMDMYPFQNTQLGYPPLAQHQQLTPSLVSSSPVSLSENGSPLSMDGYYDCSPSCVDPDMACFLEGSNQTANTLAHTPFVSSLALSESS